MRQDNKKKQDMLNKYNDALQGGILNMREWMNGYELPYKHVSVLSLIQ